MRGAPAADRAPIDGRPSLDFPVSASWPGVKEALLGASRCVPRSGSPVIVAALCVYLGFASEFFWRCQNLLNITEAVAVVGIAAAFATVVVISGGLDLSPVAVITMTGIVVTECVDADMRVVPSSSSSLLAASADRAAQRPAGRGPDAEPVHRHPGHDRSCSRAVAFVVTDGQPQDVEDASFNELGQSKVWFDIPIDTVWMVAVVRGRRSSCFASPASGPTSSRSAAARRPRG